MLRLLSIVSAIALLACGAAKQRRAEEHLRNELNFYVPYVDLDAEESATRRVLGQRQLRVEKEVRGDGFRALEALSLDRKRGAVRIITRRGVVAAEDADADDWFALRKVALWTLATRDVLPETLLGIERTARGHDAGCLSLHRLEPDGRLSDVELRIDQFGSFACLADLVPLDKASFAARLVWPGLSAGVAPTLALELRGVTPPLNAPAGLPLVLRVAEEGAWVERAGQILAESASTGTFAQRQARAVAHAALALAKRQSVEQQLGAYRSALGGARPGSAEAEVMAATIEHIQHAWHDPDAAPADGAATPDGTGPTPSDVVIEPDLGG
ncbi:MAG TPA: hypothetical protein VFZ61_12585 [Polyangiales bacterium]